MNFRRKNLNLNGKNFFYYDNKKKKTPLTLLFCHANGYSSECYHYYLRRLGVEYRVLGINLFNHGGSDIDMKFTNWSFYSDQIREVIQYENLENVVGVGHSMGMPILAHAAYKYPELFHSLIGLDPTFLNLFKIICSRLLGNSLSRAVQKRKNSFRKTSKWKLLFKRHPITRTWHNEVLKDYLHSCFKEINGQMFLCCPVDVESKNFRTPSYSHILKTRYLKVPIHLIAPQNSYVCSKRMAEKLIKNHPGSTLFFENDLSHHFPFEKPEWTLNQIKKILSAGA